MKSANLRNILLGMILISLILIPTRLVFGQATPSTQVGVFDQLTMSPDSRLEVPIEIKKVDGLYALDLTMQFDPTVLSADDADPTMPGVQLALGKFLDAGLVLFNTVDNQTGTVHFVMTEFNPSEPKNGDGILLVVYFKALKQGQSNLSFTSVQLSTRDGIQIPATTVDSVIKVDASIPTVVSTEIPVIDPTEMIQIPTSMPTPTPTILPATQPTSTPTQIVAGQKSASELTPGADQGIPITGKNGQDSLLQSAELFIFNNWWIVLVLLLLVIIAGVYLVVSRKAEK